jgi:GxxExxY protein
MESRSPDQYDTLTEQIIGAAIEVHKVLGPGMLESIYEEALCIEFGLRGLTHERQVELDVQYKGHVIKGQRLDLLVQKEVILEIKSLQKVPEVVMAQMISYLRASGLKRGLILNFGCQRMLDGIQRVSL